MPELCAKVAAAWARVSDHITTREAEGLQFCLAVFLVGVGLLGSDDSEKRLIKRAQVWRLVRQQTRNEAFAVRSRRTTPLTLS